MVGHVTAIRQTPKIDMSKQTKAELLEEMERLQSEVTILRSQLENSLRLVLDALDRANAEVARHLRTLRVEDSERLLDDGGWD